MLEKIEYKFPKNSKNIELFNLLFILFKDLENVKIVSNNEIHIASHLLKPRTVFKLEDCISNIQFDIGEQKYYDLLNRNLKNSNSKESKIKKLSIEYVGAKLEGHILRVDHTGINLPTALYSKLEWDNLLKYFSRVSNIYSYPTGELWEFIIPATVEENQREITNFQIEREPKFELVYDEYSDNITIQIDMETDLSKLEVEALFPENEGTYFETLGNFFKSIYLDYSEYIDIRLDLRFKCPHNDFKSGEWFVFEGKRI